MDKKSTYNKWENHRITQLSFINNLVIVLSVALIGYVFDFIKPSNIILNCTQKFFFWVGLLLIIVSVFVGILTAINRLEDFRLTAKIARNREKNNREKIKADRNQAKIIGKKTWCQFVWQIATFGISFLCFSVTILIEYWDKIT
ncbi:hypothetical protein [uncultured Maribacter sp.]|uniref:hypothetical protein n=1 Tax=uncultured Maribacter sp. TaxID=431308 RepID=UPI0030EECE13|tara:strand:+ start:553 stop:984 length:432 start_codon:yes stop_codon:yes gene_type:complete